MEIKFPIYKSIIIIFLLIISINYIVHIFKTPINHYNYPENSGFLSQTEYIDQFGNSCKSGNPSKCCEGGFCYGIPFKIETSQILSIKTDKSQLNIFTIDSETIIVTERDILININEFIPKNITISPPLISLNEKLIPLIEKDNYYIINEPLYFKGNNYVNRLLINNLVMKREYFKLSEVKIPFFFNKEKYSQSLNLPQIYPLLVGIDSSTKEIVYSIEKIPFKKIDLELSGWQKVAHYYEKTIISGVGFGPTIGEIKPWRVGVINQTIRSNEETILFSTLISKENPFSSFEVHFLPDFHFLILVLIFIWIPIINDKIINKWSKKTYSKIEFVIYNYISIITLIGLTTIRDINYFLAFFDEAFTIINPLFLIIIILFPLVYIYIFDYLKFKRRYYYRFKDTIIYFI